MALPRFFALVVGLMAAFYFGFGIARYTLNPIGGAIMLLGAILLLAASVRKAVTRKQRYLVAGAWAAFSLLSLIALGIIVWFSGGSREKAMALLLFVTGLGFTARAFWQAGRKKRHKWDNYFDK
ncbi:hypothetical protein SAMN06295912_105165 [Sphingomonas laterariae]|uniref:Uncharacterized protein n=1 Tax=Edaphosphingomonas laterariae TaxID=861865 RepID=A0A239E2W7_9SPHN|nr:hypothetical protein [Sphingomonas laterariae]SNS38628.1 hypothetical protein SAMN06295912_105165 [Sphingomonas laterariae]